MTNPEVAQNTHKRNSLFGMTDNKSSIFSSVCEALYAIPDAPTFSQKSCDYKKGNKMPSGGESTRHSSEDVNPETTTGFDGQTYFDISQLFNKATGGAAQTRNLYPFPDNQQNVDRTLVDLLMYRNSPSREPKKYETNAVNRDVSHQDRSRTHIQSDKSSEIRGFTSYAQIVKLSQQSRHRRTSSTDAIETKSTDTKEYQKESDKLGEERDKSHERKYYHRDNLRERRRDRSASSNEYVRDTRKGRNRLRKHKRSSSTASESDDFMFNPANFENWEDDFNRRIAKMHENPKMKDYMTMSESTVRQILSQFVRNGRSAKTILDDEFVLLYFKTINCEINYTHNWQNCPFCHGPNDLRRPFLIFKYSPMPCKSWYRYANVLSMDYSGRCPRGKLCGESHSRKEYFYHPNCFRTETCSQYHRDGYCKRGVFCAFRH